MDGDLSEILRQVMGNPQFGQMVQAMKSQMGTGGDGGIDPAKIMEKMPEMMAALGPMMGMAGRTDDKTEAAEKSDDGSGAQKDDRTGASDAAGADNIHIDSIQSGRNGSGSMFFRPGSRDKRNKLLSALKPYLSPARCALVDRAMSAMQMGELLGTVTPPNHDT